MIPVGIDLGTTNSAAAVVEGEEAEMIKVDNDETMRSVVTFEQRIAGDQEEVVVGNRAVDFLETDPDATVAAVKRHMGKNHPITFEGEELEYQPEMISGLILKKIAQEAEENVISIDEVDSAVITVPARFSEAARNCTEAAATYAYIDDVPMLLPEPSAACVAYDIGDGSEEIERVAVYDLGGGTFDLSIVNVVPDSEGATDYVVQKNEGSQNLGGEDFDERLQEYLIEEFEAAEGVSLDDTDDPHERRARVRATAKDVKEDFSDITRVTATEPVLGPNGENMKVEVTREKFRELTSDLVDDTIEICEEVFDDLGYPPSEVDTVLAVGGSTKMLQVQDAIEEFFGKEPVAGVDPDQAVALGAAQVARKAGSSPELPAGGSGDGDEDEGGKLPGPTVHPSAPADVGFELASGELEVLIEEDMTLPAEVTGRNYSTEEDYQTKAEIRVFRGPEEGETDEKVAENNVHIKTFELDNIQEAKAGEPDIAVRFEMDRSGIVRAEAWDESKGEDSAAESELEMEPKGGGGSSDSGSSGVSSGSEDGKAYSPPTTEEIKEMRDDLPPVT